MGSSPPPINSENMAKKKKISPMPFSTSDWLRCPELKVLSADVRGLWIDMLCYMWESSERGVMLKPNGDPMSKYEVARLLGVDASGSFDWIDKLIDNKVCSVRADGAIYSRRMVRDHAISIKRSEAGRKGGNTTRSRIIPTEPVVKAAEAPVPTVDPPKQDPPKVEQTAPPPKTAEEEEKAAKARKYKYADSVSLTRDEYSKLVEHYSEEDAKGMIELLDNYKGQNGKRYKSDYKAILNWVVNAYYERKQKSSYDTQRTGGFPGSGNANNQIQPNRTGNTQPGTVQPGSEEAQKDYSDRFV